jgi:hypothetical protein
VLETTHIKKAQHEALGALRIRLSSGFIPYLYEHGTRELLSTLIQQNGSIITKEQLDAIPRDTMKSLLVREAKFATRVLSNCLSARDPTILFWDVDETIGTYSLWGSSGPWIARPCIEPLLRQLKELRPNIKQGVISIRSQEGLTSAIYDGTHPLKLLAPFVCRELIYGNERTQSLYRGEDCRDFKLSVLSQTSRKTGGRPILVDDLNELRGCPEVIWVGDLCAPDMLAIVGPHAGCSADAEE